MKEVPLTLMDFGSNNKRNNCPK